MTTDLWPRIAGTYSNASAIHRGAMNRAPMGNPRNLRRTKVGFFNTPLVLTVLAAALLWSSFALAQQPGIRPYETEEDLREALNEAEITFDEFLDLLDAHRVGQDSAIAPQSD